MKKIIYANDAAKTRMEAIAMYQNGKGTLKDIADRFGVHLTTISEWINMYEQGGVQRLKAPLKPRPKHVLDAKALEALAQTSDDRRIHAILALAQGKGLNETASQYNVTPQGLAKWRRQYLNGELSN